MDEQERIARELAPQLDAALHGLEVGVEVTGAGFHWQVIAHTGERACTIHCFHYSVGSIAEYYLIFRQSQRDRAAIGRTRDVEATLDAVRRWLTGAELDELYRAHAFVDRSKRAHLHLQRAFEQALASDPIQARVALETASGEDFELWVYADDRSCRLTPCDGGPVAGLLCIRTTPVIAIEVADPERAAALVREWIAARRSLADLLKRYPTAQMLPHAQRLEAGDVAGWSWANLRDRAQDPESSAAPHRPWLEEVLRHPAITRFFAFTSHHRMCFSRCSDHPFATDGMPIVIPAPDGNRYTVVVGARRWEGDVDETLELLERVLSKIADRPWHGVAAELLIEPINAELADRGSRLRLRMRQRMQWLYVIAASASHEVVIDVDHGQRFCALRLDSAEQTGLERARPRSASEAAEQLIDWLSREAG